MRKNILFLFLGMIIAGSISVVAYQMNANQVTYQPKDNNWNVKTVKEAIDYIKENTVSNKDPINVSFDSGNLSSTDWALTSMQVSDFSTNYKYFKILSVESSPSDVPSTHCNPQVKLVSGGQPSANINSQYETKDVKTIIMASLAKTSGSWTLCKANVRFYN